MPSNLSKSLPTKFLFGPSITTSISSGDGILLFSLGTEILFITGKGIHSKIEKDVFVSKDLSKLRYSVPDYIKSDKELSKYIISISNADRKDGGDGAIIVKLKKL